MENKRPESIVLGLEGDVSIKDFSTAVKAFSGLLHDLSQDVAGVEIEWSIDYLAEGSAYVGVVGYSQLPEAVEKVTMAIYVIAEHLERQQRIPYSAKIERRIEDLLHVLDGKIEAVVLGVGERMHQISAKYQVEVQRRVSLGIIRGYAETLSKRRGYKIVVYDDIWGRPIHCYLSPEQENLMRNAWGKRVLVAGFIERNERGEPVKVRDVHEIKILEDAQPGDYRQVEGIITPKEGLPPPEEAVRRLRDEW